MNQDIIIYNLSNAILKNRPAINVSKYGHIYFNHTLCKSLKLTHGSKIIIAQGKHTPQDWFIIIPSPEQQSEALQLKVYKGKTNLMINSKIICKKFHSSCQNLQTNKIEVNTTPDENQRYHILTQKSTQTIE